MDNSTATTPRPTAIRATSLDALRGYAILTMVLSATIVFGIMPAWMYHAQTPPPSHAFTPELAGLTWVDLVFPFFLFAMGAAFPFSIGKKIARGESKAKALWNALTRMFKLTFFAIFIQHFYPYMLSAPQDFRAWMLAITCFALLFPMFMRIPVQMPEWARLAVKAGAYAVAVVMMAVTPYAAEKTFSLFTSNIIILLLANMAFFGAAIYVFTVNNWWARVAVLLALSGILLSAETDGSWAQTVYSWTPLPWMYCFGYLDYLLIVIPGSMAGDLLFRWMTCWGKDSTEDSDSRVKAWVMLATSVLIVVAGLVGLQCRESFVSFFVIALLLLVAWMTCRKGSGSVRLWRELSMLAAVLLIVGMCFEPFQGGIKKDGPTFSYLLVSSGMATVALIAFHVICDYFKCHRSTAFLVMSGQNPMIAYVACDLLIYPVLNILNLTQYLAVFSTNAWLGFLQGVILTSLAIIVTMFFTRIKWFWRT